jgi:hypothetical protein
MLHDADAEPPPNKAHNEQQEENLKQILLTVLNLNQQRFHVENLHQNHQSDQRNSHLRYHHHRLGTLMQNQI